MKMSKQAPSWLAFWTYALMAVVLGVLALAVQLWWVLAMALVMTYAAWVIHRFYDEDPR